MEFEASHLTMWRVWRHSCAWEVSSRSWVPESETRPVVAGSWSEVRVLVLLDVDFLCRGPHSSVVWIVQRGVGGLTFLGLSFHHSLISYQACPRATKGSQGKWYWEYSVLRCSFSSRPSLPSLFLFSRQLVTLLFLSFLSYLSVSTLGWNSETSRLRGRSRGKSPRRRSTS